MHHWRYIGMQYRKQHIEFLESLYKQAHPNSSLCFPTSHVMIECKEEEEEDLFLGITNECRLFREASGEVTFNCFLPWREEKEQLGIK